MDADGSMEGMTFVSSDYETLDGTGNFSDFYLVVRVVLLAHEVGWKAFLLAGTLSVWVQRVFVSSER